MTTITCITQGSDDWNLLSGLSNREARDNREICIVGNCSNISGYEFCHDTTFAQISTCNAFCLPQLSECKVKQDDID